MRGRYIKRYSYDWAGLWLINTHNGIKGKIPRIDINDYPAIKAHLDQFWDKIKTRADQGDTPYNLRNCAYSDDFSQPKIVWIELTDESKFALSTDGLIPLNTVFFMVGKHIKYLLAVINSSLFHWYFQHTLGSTSGVGTNRWLKYTVECIPVPLIQDDAEWESLVDDIQKYKRDSKDSAVLENIIDNKVFDLYGLSEDERAFTLNSHTKR